MTRPDSREPDSRGGEASRGGPAAPAVDLRDLGIRLVSALALAAVALSLTWLGGWPFTVLVAAVGVIVAWEWGRIVRQAGKDRVFALSAAAVVAAAVLATAGHAGAALVVLVVLAAAAGLLADAEHRWAAAGGVFYAGLPVLALAWLRAAPDYGLALVMFVFLLVWATDTCAYLAGRLIGGPKLWPAVSPKKTWSGLIGGISAAGVVGWVFGLVLGSAAPAQVGALAVALAAFSQLGDLVESTLKRKSGVKDASQLIPGHGGFMDRVDGLIFAAAAAAALAALAAPASPAQVLLAIVPN